MAETNAATNALPGRAPANGRALRVYQLLIVLAVGWMVGRLPQILADRDAESARLLAAIQPAAQAGAGMAEAVPRIDTARLAADVAAQVAAQVANDTVAQLIAAGWGPRTAAQQIVIQAPPGLFRPSEATVRIVTEPQQAVARIDYDLPPGQQRPVLPPELREAGDTATVSAVNGKAHAEAHATATRGYAALRDGDKRNAVRLLSDAVKQAPDSPQAAQWNADVQRLTRRWSLAAYTLARNGGLGDPLAASPVLGGGQSGAAVAYTIDPLARRPVSVVARIAAAANPDGSIDREATEAAVGLRVQPLPGVPLAVDIERRIALGAIARNAWAARVSGGTAGATKVAGRAVNLETYGEAGIVGFEKAPDYYAGAQARGATPLFSLGRVGMDGGAGVWGGVQRGFGSTASRLDLGPSARFRVAPWAFSAQLDYRFQAAGNAIPGSGPVLTVSGEF